MEMIRFENVTKTYQIGDCVLNALDDVNVSSKGGIFVVIQGPYEREINVLKLVRRSLFIYSLVAMSFMKDVVK